jgi:hypothetical protein
MDWASFTSPQVIAPTAGLFGVLVGAGISSWTTHSTHRKRLAGDQALAERKIEADIALAERKFEFDQRLAERKVELEITLAERKVAFDKALAVWRRRYDLAEQVLAAAYEARDGLIWARGRGVFSGEGETRTATEPENDKLREARNSAFVPIERLARNAKAFASLQTLQDTVAAHFGPQAIKPISAIIGVHHSITSTASILVRMVDGDEDYFGRQQLLPLRKALWGERPDETDRKLDAAIEQLEAICKPVLSAEAPT